MIIDSLAGDEAAVCGDTPLTHSEISWMIPVGELHH